MADETPQDYEKLYHLALRRLERERKIRREAEAIAERGLAELYRRNDQQQLLETIVSCANTTSSGKSVIEVTLRETCRSLGMSCGMAFLQDGGHISLNSPLLYSPATAETAEKILEVCRLSGLFFPQGIAARITEEQKILSWMPGEKESVPDTLAHALGFPVIANGTVRALLVFFSCAEVRAEEPVVGLCMNIGGHIARVMEREQARNQLLHDATHDPLTGLPNRTSFHHTLTETVNGWLHPAASPAVCLIDLDGFKEINDRFGHLAGDMFLRETARRFTACVRKFPECSIARLGGDEFTACLNGLPDRSTAIRIAESFCQAMDAPLTFEGHRLHSTASIGIAFCEAGETDTSKLLKMADLSMYESKKRGGNVVTVASPGTQDADLR